MDRHTEDSRTVKIGYGVRNQGANEGASRPHREQAFQPMVQVYNGEHYVAIIPRRMLMKFSVLACNVLPRISSGQHQRPQQLVLTNESASDYHPDNNAIRTALNWIRRNAGVRQLSDSRAYPFDNVLTQPINELLDLYLAAQMLRLRGFPHDPLKGELINRIPAKPSLEFIAWLHKKVPLRNPVMTEALFVWDKAYYERQYSGEELDEHEAYIRAKGNEQFSVELRRVTAIRKAKRREQKALNAGAHARSAQNTASFNEASTPATGGPAITPAYDPTPAEAAAATRSRK